VLVLQVLLMIGDMWRFWGGVWVVMACALVERVVMRFSRAVLPCEKEKPCSRTLGWRSEVPRGCNSFQLLYNIYIKLSRFSALISRWLSVLGLPCYFRRLLLSLVFHAPRLDLQKRYIGPAESQVVT
jgi:hypothetical protein